MSLKFTVMAQPPCVTEAEPGARQIAKTAAINGRLFL